MNHMEFNYIRKTYNVPACTGRRVKVYGKLGTIVRDCGHHLGVNFDEDKPSRVCRVHPTSEVEYLEKIVTPRRISRSAKRYQEWLNADTGHSFANWIGAERRSR